MTSWNFDGYDKKKPNDWNGNWENFRPQRPQVPVTTSAILPAPYRLAVEPPSIALTLVITLLFGVFGAIPAAIHADRARAMGAPTGKYWGAFFIPLGCAVVLLMLIIAAS